MSLSASGFQEPEALLPINNNKSDVHSKDDLEKLSFDVIIKTNDGSVMIQNVEEPLTNVKQLNSDPWGLENGGDSQVDYLNDTVLTTSKVDEGNQTTTLHVGKGDQTSVRSSPVKASWKISSSSLRAQTLSQTVSPPIVGAESPLASLPDALNSPGF